MKDWLGPGAARSHSELWFPSDTPLDLGEIARTALERSSPCPPAPASGARQWFGWARPASVALWLRLEDAHGRRNGPQSLPQPPGPESNDWPPSGMHTLGACLAWAASPEAGQPPCARSVWAFHHGAWLAGRGDAEAALAALEASDDGRAHALAARLLLRVRRDAAAAAARYRRIADPAILRHPQVVFERDVALERAGAALARAGDAVGAAACLAERRASLDAVGALFCGGGGVEEWLLERHAALLGAEGRPADGLRALEGSRFQLVHQRYARTALWRRLKRAAGPATPASDRPCARQQALSPAPESLGEDQLAAFGAYAEFEEEGADG